MARIVAIATALAEGLRATDARVRALACLAEMGLAFGPTTSIADDDDVVWIDVTGCAHLYADEPRADETRDGTRVDPDAVLARERRLVRALAARVEALGFDARCALADGPDVAAAVARHHPAETARLFVVPEGKNVVALRALPLAAWPVPDEVRRTFARLGMRTLGDLQKLPREALGARLGGYARRAMAFLEGDDRRPLAPYAPPEVPEERAEFDDGVLATEALVFVLKALCDRMAPRLAGRGLSASRLELVFALDRALVRANAGDGDGEGEPPWLRAEISLVSPLREAADLFAVLRVKVSGLTLRAPARAVTLRVPELVRVDGRARELFVPEARAALALPRLAAELEAELGAGRVGVLELGDTWLFSERTRLAPVFRKPAPVSSLSFGLLTRGIEPTRVLSAAAPLPKRLAAAMHLVLRLEAVAWWREGVIVTRDYGTAWFEGSGLAWVERCPVSGEIQLTGWVD